MGGWGKGRNEGDEENMRDREGEQGKRYLDRGSHSGVREKSSEKVAPAKTPSNSGD